jgi:hypothetical protein
MLEEAKHSYLSQPNQRPRPDRVKFWNMGTIFITDERPLIVEDPCSTTFSAYMVFPISLVPALSYPVTI